MEILKSDFHNISFYEFKLGSNAAQTVRNINIVWGEGSVNIRTVQRWFVQFRSGNSSVEDYGDCSVVYSWPHSLQLPESWRDNYNGGEEEEEI